MTAFVLHDRVIDLVERDRKIVAFAHSVTVKVPSFCCSNSLTSSGQSSSRLRDLDKYPVFRNSPGGSVSFVNDSLLFAIETVEFDARSSFVGIAARPLVLR